MILHANQIYLRPSIQYNLKQKRFRNMQILHIFKQPGLRSNRVMKNRQQKWMRIRGETAALNVSVRQRHIGPVHGDTCTPAVNRL